MFTSITLSQLLTIIGIPSLATICKFIWNRVKANDQETETIKAGLQALLRGQMINDFNHWLDKGYAPIYAKENFENMWTQYHNLGANGVMDGIHERFLELPEKRPPFAKEDKQ